VSAVKASGRRGAWRARLRRLLTEAGSVMLGIVLLIWSVTPVYNMLLIALDPEEGEVEFSGNLWPPQPSLESFRVVLTQDARYLEHFWRQLGNSLYIGLSTMCLTALIASLASFAVGRMRLGRGWLSTSASVLTSASLLPYAIPAPFLIFPFHRIMHDYGLSNNPGAVIAAQVTFATPFAILILLHYARLIPIELDDAARVDGASTAQVFRRVYLPLTAPALAVVATYALVLAWNDYLYQFVLLSSERHMTAAVMQAQLFDDADPPWNAMMAAAVIYSLPPVAIFFALRRTMMAALTSWRR
jgi:multiple sugar transport system permease protein